MQAEEYDKIANELLNEAHEIEISKRPAYTIGSSDVFQNFKSIAARTNQSPLQILCTYWLKHVDAITAFFSNPDIHQAEPIRSRFADCINYLKLGYALSGELREQENAKSIQLPRIPQIGDVLVGEGSDHRFGFIIERIDGETLIGNLLKQPLLPCVTTSNYEDIEIIPNTVLDENYVYQSINSPKKPGQAIPFWRIATEVEKEGIGKIVAELSKPTSSKLSMLVPLEKGI